MLGGVQGTKVMGLSLLKRRHSHGLQLLSVLLCGGRIITIMCWVVQMKGNSYSRAPQTQTSFSLGLPAP